MATKPVVKPQSKTAPQKTPEGKPAPGPRVLAPDPKQNPLKNLPLPEMPKRKPGRPPKLAKPTTTTEEATPPTTEGEPPPTIAPASSWRRLPSDPTQAELALAPHRLQAAPMVAMVDGLCQTLPPQIPLATGEKNGLEMALANVMYSYNEEMNPLWGLALVACGIAIPRVIAYRMQRAIPEGTPETKAAA